jgi:DNA-directed RNA polymerase I subunit RPA49
MSESTKRKREHEIVHLNVSVNGDRNVAALGQFSGVNVAEGASFAMYKSKYTGQTFVHGESDRMEYDGYPETDKSRYCLAIYDETSSSVELVPASMFSMNTVIKARKKSNVPAIRQASVKYYEQRAALGEAFGSKKAKKIISEAVKNKIDAEQLQDLETAIVDTVKTSTENLPSQETRQKALSEDRPIPPYNLEATQPSAIYPIVDGLLSNREYSAIKTNAIEQESIEKNRMALFPKASQFITSRVSSTLNAPGNHTHRLKLLYYASLLMAVYEHRRVSSKTALAARLGSVPEVLLSGIIEKFTAVRSGQFGKAKDRNFIIDPTHESKLLCYLLVLILNIEQFHVDVNSFTTELGLKASKLVDLCKAIGCDVRSISGKEAEARGIKKSHMAVFKVATLNAPLKLPEVVKRTRSGPMRR